MAPPRLWLAPLRCPRRASNSRLGTVTRAAGERPRAAGIDGQSESLREADSRREDSPGRSNEAEARRRSFPAFSCGDGLGLAVEELAHPWIGAFFAQLARVAFRDDSLLPAIQHDHAIGDRED